MESATPTVVYAALALAWAVLVAVVLATVWLVSRMSSKVDWKSYHHDQNALKESIAELSKDIATLLERSEQQNKLSEFFLQHSTPQVPQEKTP